MTIGVEEEKEKMGRGPPTVVLLLQMTGDQEWEEEGEKMGRRSLTALLLPQVTGDQQ
jgi:hypothetical protein